jgi:glycerol-3-phosphate acyltransferase PlsY
VQIILCIIAAYLCGSYPSGKVYGIYLRGVDIQQQGSGNIGFANACRVLGVKIGILVLLSDVLKGFLPLFLAYRLLHADPGLLMAMGAAAIIGHAYPVWLRFKGGKSIATGLGVILMIAPVIGALAALTYICTFLFTRISGISSVVGAWSLVLWTAAFDMHLVYYCVLLALFATYTHRTNIGKLIAEYAA